MVKGQNDSWWRATAVEVEHTSLRPVHVHVGLKAASVDEYFTADEADALAAALTAVAAEVRARSSQPPAVGFDGGLVTAPVHIPGERGPDQIIPPQTAADDGPQAGGGAR